MTDKENLPFREVRAELPMSDADFAAIRSSVMKTVSAERARGSWSAALRLAFAAGAVALILIVILRVDSPRQGEPSGQQRASGPMTAPAAPPSIVSRPPVQVVENAEPTRPTKVAIHHSPRRPRRHRPELVAASAPEPLTVQLQTSNPDIRIIWITR